jgi:hypothetical protein
MVKVVVGCRDEVANAPPLYAKQGASNRDSRRVLLTFISKSTIFSPTLPSSVNIVHYNEAMSNFFDIKARKAAAATNGSSSKTPASKESQRSQPWVEK